MFVGMCNTQKHHFNNFVYLFTKILSRKVIITSYSFNHDVILIPEILLFHALEWLIVVVRDILQNG